MGDSPAENPVRQFQAAMREAGLWTALPWASASSGIFIAALFLCMVPFWGILGWVGVCIGAFLILLTGLGGVVTQPLSRVALGVLCGELAAICVVIGALLGVVATTPAAGVWVGLASVALSAMAMPLGAAWAYLRWNAPPLGRAVVAVWALSISVIPVGGYLLAGAVLGRTLWLP